MPVRASAFCHRSLSASCPVGKPAESGTVCGTCALRGAQEARAFAGGLSAVGTVCGTCALRGAQEARAFAGGLSAVLAKKRAEGGRGLCFVSAGSGYGSAPGRADGLLCVAGRACRSPVLVSDPPRSEKRCLTRKGRPFRDGPFRYPRDTAAPQTQKAPDALASGACMQWWVVRGSNLRLSA